MSVLSHDTLPGRTLARPRPERRTPDSGGMDAILDAHAELVLPPGADDDLWLRTRRTGIGGSDALAVAGLSRWASPYEVWLDKTGRLPARTPTLAMRLGHLLEPIVARLFTEETGITVTDTGTWRSRAWPYMLANPDRLTADGALLECKTTNSFGGREWRGGLVPDHAEGQVEHYAAVTGAPGAYVAALVANTDIEIRWVPRDDDLIEDLADLEGDFWKLVTTDTEPPIDGHPATTEALKRVYDRVQAHRVELPEQARGVLLERQRVQERIKDATAELDKINNQLRAWLADAHYGTIGDVAVVSNKTVVSRRVPVKRLRELHPDIVAALEVEDDHRSLKAMVKGIREISDGQ